MNNKLQKNCNKRLFKILVTLLLVLLFFGLLTFLLFTIFPYGINQNQVAEQRNSKAKWLLGANVSVSKDNEAAKSENRAKSKIDPDKSLPIMVHKGPSEVISQGKTLQITENSAGVIQRGQTPIRSVSLQVPPTLISPPHLNVFYFRELAPQVLFAWFSRHVGDVFRLQLAYDETFKDILIDRRITEARFTHGNLKKGVYYWRVCRIEHGREDRFSETHQFDLVQDLVPPLLQVYFPTDQILTNSFVLTGLTNPGCSVYVRGKAVSIDAKGAFSCEIIIKSGMNLVAVEAIDAAGNVTYRSQYVWGRF